MVAEGMLSYMCEQGNEQQPLEANYADSTLSVMTFVPDFVFMMSVSIKSIVCYNFIANCNI